MTERTYTADKVDAMIARAVAADRPLNTLHFAQWTNGEKDLSNYILVGSLTLAGIEDNEYGQSEIDSLENTIEALQERLVTGSEHKKVPLLAYIGELNTTPPAAQKPWVGLTDGDVKEIREQCDSIVTLHAIKAIEAKLKEKNTAAQPVVPDAIHHTDLSEHPQYIEGWNDCRAARQAQLKGIEAVKAIKQALAAQPAPVQEPVGYVAENGVVDWNVCAPPILTDLYTTPPAAPIPDAIHHTDLSEHPQYIEGWNDCRQAMMEMMK